MSMLAKVVLLFRGGRIFLLAMLRKDWTLARCTISMGILRTRKTVCLWHIALSLWGQILEVRLFISTPRIRPVWRV
ncbi:hypothetical protein A1D30_07615 [Acidovorax sp. GW101-3H11]|nr:hypothetical protein A1D30_07615 [Acidovorax sp. GW101-3H11]